MLTNRIVEAEEDTRHIRKQVVEKFEAEPGYETISQPLKFSNP